MTATLAVIAQFVGRDDLPDLPFGTTRWDLAKQGLWYYQIGPWQGPKLDPNGASFDLSNSDAQYSDYGFVRISSFGVIHKWVRDIDLTRRQEIQHFFVSYRMTLFRFSFWLWSTAPLPALWLLYFANYRLALREFRSQGRCSTCGYDLRASPHRCPECGAQTPSSLQAETTDP